jgi:putative glycerol-1-phosphate prenyltransferase
MTYFEKLMAVRADKGAGLFLLLDPDRTDRRKLLGTAEVARDFGVDALLVGTSFVTRDGFSDSLAQIKKAAKIPVILFPGNWGQVSRHADAILFLSLISGRNPTYLIEEQVRGAPLIKDFGLEPIPTGYMLIESNATTAVQYVSGTLPIPRNKPEIAMVHALAAKYMGMKLVYLEAGSGTAQPVPTEMVTAVADYAKLPIVVGGGIRTPATGRQMVQAGASFVVIGTQMENEHDPAFLAEMADAVHVKSIAQVQGNL